MAFISQIEPKDIHEALKHESWINAMLEEYVDQPPGFEDTNHLDYVFKLKKALYGLKQAPRAWYDRLSTFLLNKGYLRGKVDQTLFIKK